MTPSIAVVDASTPSRGLTRPCAAWSCAYSRGLRKPGECARGAVCHHEHGTRTITTGMRYDRLSRWGQEKTSARAMNNGWRSSHFFIGGIYKEYCLSTGAATLDCESRQTCLRGFDGLARQGIVPAFLSHGRFKPGDSKRFCYLLFTLELILCRLSLN